jgi:hypothetical protein
MGLTVLVTHWIVVPIYGGSRPHHVSYKGEEMTKEEALVFVLRVLKNPMMIMSPDKTKAMNLAAEHNISGIDLIKAYENIVMRV